MQTEHRFTFTGNAREYFGIWIVNLFLSVITIGIYTAWAKVRRLRYFYGNTHLDGHSFDYHARPLSILIGRIIVMVALVVFNVLAQFTPFAALLFIPYAIALPWIINKGIAFNARVTSYRNVRFGFKGNYWSALGIFILMPIVAAISLGLLAPVLSRMIARYIGNNLSYGGAQFNVDVAFMPFYRNLGASILFAIIAGILAVAVGMAIGAFAVQSGMLAGLDPQGLYGVDHIMRLGMQVGAALSIYLTAFLVFIFYRAGVRNIAYNHTTIDSDISMASTLSRRRYAWIIASNLLITILTIGLARAWAAVRTWKYLVAHTALNGPETLDRFVDEKADTGQVAAAEFMDIEGLDFGI